MSFFPRTINALLTRIKSVRFSSRLKKSSNKFTKFLKRKFHKKLKKSSTDRNVTSYVRDFLFLMLIILLWIQIQILVSLNNQGRLARQQFMDKVRNYSYWKSVASQFPNIPDILYNTSISALEAGHSSDALLYVNKAIQLDPVFKKAQDLREKLMKM